MREVFLGRLVAAPRQKLAKEFAYRVEGRVLVKCSGRRLDPRVRCTCDLFTEALHQTRFADPRFSHDQRHLAFTVERALPTNHVSPRDAAAASRRPRTPLGCITR